MNSYLIFVLAVLIFSEILDLATKIFNLKSLLPELPEIFRDTFDAEKYEKSQNYTKVTTKFSILKSLILTTLTIAFILLGGFNFVDNFARSFELSSIFTGLIFTGTLILISSALSLPFTLYGTFVIEQKFGFNKTTVKTFILDLIKGLILGALIGGILLSIVLWFFETFSDLAWVYAWISVILFSLFLTFLAPILIMPLFNKFVPLQEGKLKTAIETYAKQQNFKLQGIFTMDGSKRSSKLNAFFTGFGKFRRIVFYDTLIEKMTTEEIISVLAHEMGHYKLKHITKRIFTSFLTTGLMFFVLSLFLNNKELFEAFKMENISVYGSLVFFAFLYSPIELILGIYENISSRKHEFQADAYSVTSTKTIETMVSALKKLSAENLSNLTPHPFYVFLNYSHPPVLQRIQAIQEIKFS